MQAGEAESCQRHLCFKIFFQNYLIIAEDTGVCLQGVEEVCVSSSCLYRIGLSLSTHIFRDIRMSKHTQGSILPL